MLFLDGRNGSTRLHSLKNRQRALHLVDAITFLQCVFVDRHAISCGSSKHGSPASNLCRRRAFTQRDDLKLPMEARTRQLCRCGSRIWCLPERGAASFAGMQVNSLQPLGETLHTDRLEPDETPKGVLLL